MTLRNTEKHFSITPCLPFLKWYHFDKQFNIFRHERAGHVKFSHQHHLGESCNLDYKIDSGLKKLVDSCSYKRKRKTN